MQIHHNDAGYHRNTTLSIQLGQTAWSHANVQNQPFGRGAAHFPFSLYLLHPWWRFGPSGVPTVFQGRRAVKGENPPFSYLKTEENQGNFLGPHIFIESSHQPVCPTFELLPLALDSPME